MPKRSVDNLVLERLRQLDAVVVLRALEAHLKLDETFQPLQNRTSRRWHASLGGGDYEFVCTGPRFYDTRARAGGCGAVDLVMHTLRLDFKAAVTLLVGKGL